MVYVWNISLGISSVKFKISYIIIYILTIEYTSCFRLLYFEIRIKRIPLLWPLCVRRHEFRCHSYCSIIKEWIRFFFMKESYLDIETPWNIILKRKVKKLFCVWELWTKFAHMFFNGITFQNKLFAHFIKRIWHIC